MFWLRHRDPGRSRTSLTCRGRVARAEAGSETRARRETRVKRDAGLQGWFVAHFNPFGGSILRDYVGYIYILYIYRERETSYLISCDH